MPERISFFLKKHSLGRKMGKISSCRVAKNKQERGGFFSSYSSVAAVYIHSIPRLYSIAWYIIAKARAYGKKEKPSFLLPSPYPFSILFVRGWFVRYCFSLVGLFVLRTANCVVVY